MIGVFSLLVMDGAFLAHLFLFAHELPDKIASHFRFNGEADQWISRRTYLAIIACLGPGLSLAWLAVAFAVRNAPARLQGLHLVWAGSLLLGFIFGIHLLTLRANRAAPARLPMGLFWALFSVFQIGLVLLVLTWPR